MSTPKPSIPLVDLRAQYATIQTEIDGALARVLQSGRFIGGPEVAAFEREWAAYCGAEYCVGVSSGTAALELTLRALGVGLGDEVIVPALTFTATAEAVCSVDALPVFVDVEPRSLTLDLNLARRYVSQFTAAIIPVHLYGQPVDTAALSDLTTRGVRIVQDAAQAHGTATPYGGFRTPLAGPACFSFYPGKNLGAYGDAGAVVTDDESLAKRIRRLADHGRTEKYEHLEVGQSARLDAMQAAVLRAKLPHLNGWTVRRREIAEHYSALLEPCRQLLLPPYSRGRVWHQYVVRHPQRDALASYLAERGIETGIHYPTPLHLQPAYSYLGGQVGRCPVAERACQEILSLPLYPEMTSEQVELVADAVKEFCRD